jgi:DNA/RNA endonuclease G (NUC1)
MKRMAHIFLILLIQLTSFATFATEIIGTVPLSRNENIFSMPKEEKNTFLPEADSEIIISREQYVLSYNKNRRLLNWAEWKIEESDLGKITRTNKFSVDQELDDHLNKSNQHAVVLNDYKGSCFDRGHQVPSADRTSSVENNEMTFVLSNMVPQTHYLNRVIWRNFENYARSLVNKQNKKVYVIAGPIYDEDYGRIGVNHDIPVPSKNFKVLIVMDKNQSINDANANTQVIAVVMPNKLKSGKKPFEDVNELCHDEIQDGSNLPVSNDWRQYQTSVAEVERLSGLTIFHRRN